MPFTDIVTESMFNQMFPNRNSLYQYNSLIVATQRFPNFCNNGSDRSNKNEAAAFLANIAHETGQLRFVEEINPQSNYIDYEHPCGYMEGQSYHGRGPIQLSWNYNYDAASKALYYNQSLWKNPQLVATNDQIAFETALWFWMSSDNNEGTCHNAIADNSDFEKTIRIINIIDTEQQKQTRRKFYDLFKGMLGI